MAGTYEIPEEGSPNSTQDPKIKTMLKGLNENLNTENDWTTESIQKGFLGRWYTPTIIATEQERENVAFGTLTTADEVKSVVLPENGIMVIAYVAKWKSSVSAAGRAAIFLGATQLKVAGTAASAETSSVGTGFNTLGTGVATGITSVSGENAFSTTGQVLGSGEGVSGGVTSVFAAAGTYNVSIQFKATSGKIAAKERKLWVGVIGV